MSVVLSLYRQIRREASLLPSLPVRKKVLRNAELVFRLYRDVESAELIRDAEAAVRVLRWLRTLPQVGQLPRASGAMGDLACDLCPNDRIGRPPAAPARTPTVRRTVDCLAG